MLGYSHEDWKSRAAGLSFRGQAFIDGKFVDAASGKTFDSINPATGAVLTQVAECDEEDINRARHRQGALRLRMVAGLGPHPVIARQ